MGQFKETWRDICRVLDEVAPGWYNVKGKSAAECAVEAIRKLAMRQSDRSRDEIAETEREGAGRKGMNTQLKDPAESIMDMIGQLAGLPREKALARVREVVAKHEQAPQAEPGDEEIDAIAASMPDGAGGMLKQWGYRQFARADERRKALEEAEALLRQRLDAAKHTHAISEGPYSEGMRDAYDVAVLDIGSMIDRKEPT